MNIYCKLSEVLVEYIHIFPHQKIINNSSMVTYSSFFVVVEDVDMVSTHEGLFHLIALALLLIPG